MGGAKMCDYSLQHVKSRPAKVGDKLTTRDFGTGTRGFAASEDAGVAVCVLPGTELSFAGEVASMPIGPLGWRKNVFNHRTAIFRQINKEKAMAHHDALEFPDGQIVLLTLIGEGQQATVLQLPAEPKTAASRPAAGGLRRLTLHTASSKRRLAVFPICWSRAHSFGVPRRINDRGIERGIGAIEMNADPKRKPNYNDLNRAKRARSHQEEVLDDALKNTFPASDPVSIMISEQKGATEADRT